MIRIGPLQVFLDKREIRSNDQPVRIGSRAFDILELLIRANGALVSKDDIMQRVWPRTVVEENNLQVHIAALRKALADDRDLILTVPGRGYRLAAGRHDDAPAPRDEPPPALRLAAAASALIGRERTITEVIPALDAARIVTLVGAGGIGKTRVAVEVAMQVAARFADGVAFVPLAAVSDPRFVPDAVAAALGIAEPTGSATLDTLVAHLAERRMLLVLDNCEHVIDAVAHVAGALADAHPDLRILATSREALRIRGEWLRPVPPLNVPGDDDCGDAILTTSAVQLFVARARAADQGFPLDARSLLLIAAICRRLDGLPLAIELAAARAALLGVEVLATHLDDHFRLLTGGFRTALPRHQTLQAMYDWSYRLLGEPERMLLRWLGVFRDSFSLEAVEDVVEGRGLSGTDILDAIAGLVSKSLLIREDAHGAPRYRLLATTRAYALQQLENNGECKAAALAHARFFQKLFTQAPAGRFDARSAAWLDAVRHELGNLRVALDWAFSPAGDKAVGIALAAVAVPCLFDLSLVDECCERSRVALDATRDPEIAPVSAELRMPLLAAFAAALAYTSGPTQAVQATWSELHALAVAAGDAEYELRALWGRWSASLQAGDARDALRWARGLRTRAHLLDQASAQMLALHAEAAAFHYGGEQEAAHRRLQQMLNVCAYGERRWHAAGQHPEHGIVALATFARVQWALGAPDEALRIATQAFDLARAYAPETVIGNVLAEGLIPIALLTGAFGVAERGIAALRACASRAGFRVWLACCDCYDECLKSATGAGASWAPRFRAALDALSDTGYGAVRTFLLAQYARCLAADGRAGEAKAALEAALQRCDETGERWLVAELERLGETLAGTGRPAAVRCLPT
ncbi:ATP-binding protein [Burkholderia ubonensis]|uniref:Transcriptional regulator n=1 Tax=Burkholderia ubonensis subsp. mesacidophila TaxID=265293 RepID=A0A2A4FLA3_9BURK|nr:winged helix-turn-helix domain-containing protein [Burkholderia ubonensis]PCE33462.1 transcriptional regulator [Burkholderia ubonensis subsp. mesacidophila]